MATITIQVVSGAQTNTNTRTVTGAHLARFIAAYRNYINSLASPSAGLTDSQVLDMWAKNIFASARDITFQQETQTSAQAAAAAVVPIDLAE